MAKKKKSKKGTVGESFGKEAIREANKRRKKMGLPPVKG